MTEAHHRTDSLFEILAAAVLGLVTSTLLLQAVDLAQVPRELEWAGATCIGAAQVFAAHMLLRMLEGTSKTEAETYLDRLGLACDAANLRLAERVLAGRAHLHAIREAGDGFDDGDIRKALDGLLHQTDELFDDILKNPETARKSEDFVFKTLPRLEAAMRHFQSYRTRLTGLEGDGETNGEKGGEKTDTLETRVVAALEQAEASVRQVRERALEMDSVDVEVAIDVLEQGMTGTRPR